MSKTLHSLIHSLQKAEKRSVQLAAKGEERAYMKLYEVLEAMTDYDEKKFRAKFSGISSSALSKAKEALQQHILRVLHHSHFHDHEEIQLLDAITKTYILKLKGQNELAMEMIAALKPELQLMERNALLLYVQQLEIETIRLRYLRNTPLRDFEKQYDALFDTITKAENLAQYRHDTHVTQLLRAQFGASNRINEYRQTMEKLATSARFKKKAQAKSALALDQYYIFWFWYYEMHQNIAKQTDTISEWKADAERNKDFLKKFPVRYYYILYQLGVLATEQNDQQLFKEAVRGLSTSINKIDEAEYERLVYLFSVQANALHIQNNLKAVTGLKPLFETIQGQYQRFVNAERDIYMQKQLAIAFLLKKDFAKALDYINDILNRYPKSMFSMLCQFRVLGMLCHIGLKNYLVLENLYRAFQYFVKGKADLSETEKLIVKFVQQVEKNNTAPGIQKVIEKFLPQFEKTASGNEYFFVPLFLEEIKAS